MQRIGLYVFVAVYVTTTLVISYRPVSWYVGGIFFVVSVALLSSTLRSTVRLAPAPLLIFPAVAFALVRMAFVPEFIPSSFTTLLDKKVTLTGTVTSIPDVRETSSRITLHIAGKGEATHVIAAVPLYPLVRVGDVVTVAGVLKRPAPFATDGGRVFAYDDFLRKDDVFAVMQPAYGKIIGRSGNIYLRALRVLESAKEGFISLVENILPEPESSLAVGLVVGGKQGLGTRLIDDFTKAGMLQIVVLSGYNVMIVANTILSLLKAFSKRTAVLIASISIVCFVLLAGAGSSALRAGVMALFALFAQYTGKRYEVLRALTMAVLLLTIWNPLMVAFDPGFQFSALATLGLILGSPIVLSYIRFIPGEGLREAVATTIAAELGILPLLLFQTGNLSVISVIANVVAMPVIPFAMLSSTVAAFLSIPFGYLSFVVPPLIGFPSYVSLWYVISIAQVSAAFPFASIIVPVFPFWVVIVTYTVLAVWIWYEYRKAPASSEAGAERTL